MNIRLALLLVFFSFRAFAQDLFQDISFADALQEAKQNSRLVFIQFESPSCNQCNELANKTFASKDLADRMSQTFIILRITPSHPDRKQISKDYNIVNGFGSFIIDHKGTLIKRLNYSSSSTISYEKWIDAALIEAGENMNVSEMDKMYEDGNNNPAFLELYITKKKELDLPYDSLLDIYAQQLPPDSLQSARTLRFILKMEPSVNSYAYSSITQNKPLFQKTWYEIKNQQRNTIQQNIITKSMREATRRKDVTLISRIASFLMDTEDKNLPHMETIRTCDLLLMYYYRSANFSQYLKNAVTYYDTYYLNKNLDSLRKTDSIFRFHRSVKNPFYQDSSAKRKTATTVKTGIKRDTIRTHTIVMNSFNVLNLSYADDLSQGALSFGNLPKDSDLILKAITWAELSLAIRETATAYHAYACLLYKTGQKEKAIEMQTKAIKQLKDRGSVIDTYQKYLEKMKQGVEDLNRSLYNDRQQKL